MLNYDEILRNSFAYPDDNKILNLIGSKKIVTMGEASHGTHEFYIERMKISKKLITEKNYRFIVVEGDWPNFYKVNLYIKGKSSYKKAYDLLNTFDRWPTWMWANNEMVEFVEWLKKFKRWPLRRY